MDSGTSALQAGLLATAPRDVTRGPCVALPAFACPDVATAALGAGFRVRLYDVDPRTLQPDLASVQAVLALGSSHLVVAHLYGRVVDVPAIARLAEAHGCWLIEDAAQHAGGTLDERRTGSLAPISVLSFGRGKGLNAGGGGALLSDATLLGTLPPPPAATAVAGFRALGTAAAAQLLASPRLYRVPAAIPWLGIGETSYHAPRPPQAMPASCAALLVAALAAEPEHLAARRTVEAWYAQQLADRTELLLEPLPRSVGGALRFPVLIDAQVGRTLAPLGVARSYPRTLAEYPDVAQALEPAPPTPGAARLARMLHTLPTHQLLGDRERRQIVQRLLVAP
jgi:dTDP-4-amino-4,6-dideoxygalactose transaminase